jgi:hypothetical protein
LLGAARTVHVIGLRRAWPIATYLLTRTQRAARQLGANVLCCMTLNVGIPACREATVEAVVRG